MSIFEQPDIRTNTKTGGMIRKINLTPTGVLAVLVFVFTLGAGPIHAQTFGMPACPIKANTIIPTHAPIILPDENPLGEPFSFAGTMQVTDQTSSTVFLMDYNAAVDTPLVLPSIPPITLPSPGINFTRTVKALHGETFSLTFEKGCTKSDPYGLTNCHWDWGQSFNTGYGGALQEDITSGQFIVDFTFNKHTKVQLSCPVCGGTCSPQDQNQQGQINPLNMWTLMTYFMRLPLSFTTPLPLAASILSSAGP